MCIRDRHGAIVHYSATPESDVTLHPKGFLLLDSGAQYLVGTTDITRTIALGQLTEEEKTDYTLILKGHIALSLIHIFVRFFNISYYLFHLNNISTGGEARTPDTRFWRPVLYQLSYSRVHIISSRWKTGN